MAKNKKEVVIEVGGIEKFQTMGKASTKKSEVALPDGTVLTRVDQGYDESKQIQNRPSPEEFKDPHTVTEISVNGKTITRKDY